MISGAANTPRSRADLVRAAEQLAAAACAQGDAPAIARWLAGLLATVWPASHEEELLAALAGLRRDARS